VGFSRPTGGFIPIGIDLSDPSGKTWVGGYSILTSDVPVDGFVWPLVLTAISNGNTATSVQSVTLYKTLAVAVSTFSSAAYNVPKDTFAKGETVFVKGVVALQDGKVVSLGSAAFEISGTNIAATPVAMAFSSSLSAWTGSYTLLPSDQSGSQVVTVSAGDLYGNSGSGAHQISVSGPTTGGLFVSITSPPPNSIYNRGETVTVSATVTMDGAPVTGASVQATAPSGATFILIGGAGGTYSAQYQITNADPVGPWSLTVTAHQGTQSASAQVVPAISSALKVSVIEPASGAEFNVGQTVTVKALVTYQDGSAIPAGASVSFNGPISGVVAMSVDPSDSSHKTWTGTHVITTSDVPTDGVTWNLVVSASVGGNTGASVPTAVRLFISHLGVVVSTWSSSSFTVPKDAFARGDTVFVKARVTLPDGTVVSSGAASFKITGTSVANSPVSLTFSASLQAWVGSYTLLQTDGTGNQAVSVTASDSSGNHGTGTHTIGIEVPVPAPQPLEAKIAFDPQTKDIAVKAVCNLGCVAPTSVSVTSSTQQNHGGHSDDEDDDNNGDGVLRTYTITDSGGHTLVLKVLVKTEGHELKAQLLSIQYGSSAPINLPHNELTFQFSSGRNGARHLEQSIDVKDVVNAQANFDSRKNVTHIHIETQNGDEGDNNNDNNDNGQSINLNGLWLLDLETSNGSPGVNYFQG
jgi:hypothetical protein